MADIVIKDAQGTNKTYKGISSVTFSTEQGGNVTFSEPTIAQYKIIAAELPNVTLELYDSAQTLKETKNTGDNGGSCEFWVLTPDTYTIKAKSGDKQLWENTITLNEIGVYNCKSGKPFNGYTWAEIKQAQAGDYARYMFALGDVKYLTSFMGQSSQTYTKCTLTTFDRQQNADGSGKKLMGFIIAQTSSTYKHRDASETNGISWVGSLIRKNCLKSGEEQYVYDDTVSAETSGTYYKLNEDCETFDEVTLPDAFDVNTKYYTKTVMEEDGAFIAGLPEEVKDLIEQVETPTWSGAIKTTSNSSDNTIIKTKDWLWLPSDSEIFGDNIDERYSTRYSKVGLEGKTFALFKMPYKEKNFRRSNSLWLRSPYISYSTYFCCWTSAGYVKYSDASITTMVALCFCI